MDPAPSAGVTVGNALARAHDREERIDQRILLAKVLARPIAWLLTHPEAVIDAPQQQAFEALCALRRAGHPVAYLVGEREFHGLSFEVSPAVLIPRPETELLVDCLLEIFQPGSPGRLVDLGTGSGAIAVTMACRRPLLRIVATDQDRAALDVATHNAARLGVAGRIDFRLGDWLSVLEGEQFDVIASNPPYVAEGDAHLAQGDLRFEPRGALVGGEDGLRDLDTIIAAASAHLGRGGHLLLEHGCDQALAVRNRMAAGGFVGIRSICDLAGLERVTAGRTRIDHYAAPDYAQEFT